MRLSKNFTIQEFTKSQTATRHGISNRPTEQHLESAKKLFENVVQKVRDNFGCTIINSGYRGTDLNAVVGGSLRSQHCRGEAADIEVPGIGNAEVSEWIKDNCDFDQLILEFHTEGIPDSGWVHVSYKSEGNRKSILTAMKENGKTVYKPGLIY